MKEENRMMQDEMMNEEEIIGKEIENEVVVCSENAEEVKDRETVKVEEEPKPEPGEPKVEEPKVTRVEVEETQEEERKVTPEVEPEISVQMEESSESTPFKVAQPALKDVKVVGTIDLDRKSVV